MSTEKEKVNMWPAVILLLFVGVIAYNIGYKAALIFTPCPEGKDTVYVKGNDSIVIKYVEVAHKDSAPTATRTYAPERTKIVKTENVQTPCDDSIRVYERAYVDSNGTIQVTDSVRGTLLSRSLTANIMSKEVYRTDTLIITKEVIKNLILFGPYGNINIGEKTSLTAGLIYCKGRTGYMAGYNIQNKYIQLGAFLNLKR